MAQVLAIFGPTASGKTAVAEEVARRIPAELVSADAMQVFRGLPILTNQSEARLVGYLGLDERTGVISERDEWVVGGEGSAYWFAPGMADPLVVGSGERFRL